jgi:hypothetical protein
MTYVIQRFGSEAYLETGPRTKWGPLKSATIFASLMEAEMVHSNPDIWPESSVVKLPKKKQAKLVEKKPAAEPKKELFPRLADAAAAPEKFGGVEVVDYHGKDAYIIPPGNCVVVVPGAPCMTGYVSNISVNQSFSGGTEAHVTLIGLVMP